MHSTQKHDKKKTSSELKTLSPAFSHFQIKPMSQYNRSQIEIFFFYHFPKWRSFKTPATVDPCRREKRNICDTAILGCPFIALFFSVTSKRQNVVTSTQSLKDVHEQYGRKCKEAEPSSQTSAHFRGQITKCSLFSHFLLFQASW